MKNSFASMRGEAASVRRKHELLEIFSRNASTKRKNLVELRNFPCSVTSDLNRKENAVSMKRLAEWLGIIREISQRLP